MAAREDPDPARLEGDAVLLTHAGWTVHEMSGPGADREKVLQGLRDVRMAHLTCHGFFDVHEPLDSGLLLAHAGRRPSRRALNMPILNRLDHLLTARDLVHEDLHIDLLTLRACATGRRDQHTAGNLDGLIQALLRSGVSTVIGALWNVDEHSSRTLLSDFYRNLHAEPDQPMWHAFWRAQRKMIEDPEYAWQSHPYHWAALTLYGDWSTHEQ